MKRLSIVLAIVFVTFGFTLQAQAQMTIDSSGNVEISGSGNGVVFPDRTVQTSASAPTWSQLLPVAERFTLVMNDEAVLDNETGLVWERSPRPPEILEARWYYACAQCLINTVGGRQGWRLPAYQELSSLLDLSETDPPALPAGHPFIGVQTSNLYWTSSPAVVGFGTPPHAFIGPYPSAMAALVLVMTKTYCLSGVFEEVIDQRHIDQAI